MKIWMIVAVCAFVFLVCFLLDTLFKHLFPKSKLEKSKQAVRPARRSATFGVILLFVPVVVLLFFMPEGGDTLLLIGCIAALIFGVILLVNYFSVTIYYDDEKFLYKTLRGGKKEFHYGRSAGSGA